MNMATDFDPGTGLGPRLRQVREERGLSVRELARRVGCSASLISQVERGISVPSVGVLYSLASELRSSLDYLLFGADGGAGASGADSDLSGVAGGPSGLEGGPSGLEGGQAGPDEGALIAASLHAAGLPSAHDTPIAHDTPDVSDTPDAHGAGVLLASRTRLPTGTLTFPGGGTAGETGIVQRAGARRIIDLASGVRWERLTPAADAWTDFLEVIYAPGGHSTDERRPLRHEGREYGVILSGTLQANVGFEAYELGPGDSIAFDSSTPHEYWNKTDDYVHAIWVVIHTEPSSA
jgi:DNA-binding XRE family transcriptional regulator/mannose-6-phosphate isomerase-like protein (cupin superfamily)